MLNRLTKALWPKVKKRTALIYNRRKKVSGLRISAAARALQVGGNL